MSVINNKAIYLWFAYLAVPFSGIAIDLYTPSMPAMMQSFASPRFLVQLTMSLYILGFGFSQPLVGPITDRYGRRKPIFIGAMGAIALSLLIIFARSVPEIIALRLVQGFFVALLCVPARAMIGDLFTGIEFQKKIANMTLAWGIGPIVAPWVGGHLQHWLGWQANFWFMGLYCFVLLLVLMFFIKETHLQQPDKHIFKVFKLYGEILSNGAFFSAIVFLGLICSFFFMFNIVAPFLVQHEMHYNAIVYGRVALCMGFAGICGNLFSRVVLRYEYSRVLFFMLLALSLVALTFVAFGVMHLLSLPVLLAPSMLLQFCAIALLPIAASKPLLIFPKYVGMASAALFGGGWVVSSILTYIATHLHVTHLLPLASLDLAVVICLWCLFVVQKQRKYF
jgi:MFS family permease